MEKEKIMGYWIEQGGFIDKKKKIARKVSL